MEEKEGIKEEIKEEKVEPEKGVDNKKTRMVIAYAIAALMVILIVSTLLFTGVLETLFGKDEKEKGSSNNNSERGEVVITDSTKLVSYGINNGELYLDKYIYNADTEEITDLFGEKIAKVDEKYQVILGQGAIYEKKYSTNDIDVKKLIDGKFIPIIRQTYTSDTEAANSGKLVDENNKLIGAYDNNETSGHLYLYENDTWKGITLKDLGIFGFENAACEDKHVYDNQYIITYDKTKTSENSYYSYLGIYDIKNDKELVKPVYELLVSIGDKKFIAQKDGKTGIIDVNGKVLLDFQYDFIEKVGSYYIVNKNNGIVVLDSNYKEISDVLEVGPITYHYYLCCGTMNIFGGTMFGDNLIIRIGNNPDEVETREYYYLDNHTFRKLGKGVLKTAENTLLFQEYGSTILSIYDKNLDKVKDIDFQESARNWTFNIFLKNYLVATTRSDNYSYKFFTISTGEAINVINVFEREHGEYMVRFTFTDKSKALGTITVLQGEKELGRLENASFIKYISTKNNGVSLKDNKIIYKTTEEYNGNDILIIGEKETK